MSTTPPNPDIFSQIVPNIIANGGNGLKHVILYDLTTRFVPKVLGGIGRFITNRFQKRAKQICDDMVKRSAGGKEKTSVMVLERNYTSSTNTSANDMFDAVLVTASDIPEAKFIKRTAKGIFVVDTNDEIRLCPDIYFSKLRTTEVEGEIELMAIQVYSFTIDTVQLRDYLNDLEQKYLKNKGNQLGRQLYYFDELPVNPPMKMSSMGVGAMTSVPDLSKAFPNITFNMFALHTNKSLKNIYGSSVRHAKKRVDFFLSNPGWYKEKGVPETLGFLLFGEPGTGKSSFIKAMAKDTNRHVVNLKLGPTTTIQQINNLFYTQRLSVLKDGASCTFDIPMDKRIIVMEDIDCLSCIVRASSDTSTDTDPNKLNLSVLLNILDGVLETPGRIVIMTSNNPSILDPALKRPGRIDVTIEFKKCSCEDILDILEGIAGLVVDRTRNHNILNRVWTPAEVTKVIFENIDDPIKCLAIFTRPPIDNTNGDYTKRPDVIKELEGLNDVLVPTKVASDKFTEIVKTFNCKAPLQDQIKRHIDSDSSAPLPVSRNDSKSESFTNFLTDIYNTGYNDLKYDTNNTLQTMEENYNATLPKVEQESK